MQFTEPLVKVESLVKRYPPSRANSRSEAHVAVDNVSLSILNGTTRTLAFCIACMEKPTSGRIWIDGIELTALSDRELRMSRPKVQLVFQDPAAAMNPRWTALQIVAEPLVIQNQIARSEQFDRAEELLQRVGLPKDASSRRLSAFSGGQRQRLAIARALALEPRLLILDEAFSALDCSVQAQMVNLLVELQSSIGITCLFITHDLAMAALLGDQIAVMERGKIVESGEARDVVLHPRQECTRALLAASPRMNQSSAVPRNLSQ